MSHTESFLDMKVSTKVHMNIYPEGLNVRIYSCSNFNQHGHTLNALEVNRLSVR
jgi:hypothetical protein